LKQKKIFFSVLYVLFTSKQYTVNQWQHNNRKVNQLEGKFKEVTYAWKLVTKDWYHLWHKGYDLEIIPLAYMDIKNLLIQIGWFP